MATPVAPLGGKTPPKYTITVREPNGEVMKYQNDFGFRYATNFRPEHSAFQ